MQLPIRRVEGHDRVDIASIMNEQEFQRTGLVRDAQIKKLGEMTVADYILVAEVAKLDNNHIIIVSKILNVESAKLIQTSNIQTATELDAMETACRELAARLLSVQRGKAIRYRIITLINLPLGRILSRPQPG